MFCSAPLTVGQLIEVLKGMPPDAQVLVEQCRDREPTAHIHIDLSVDGRVLIEAA